MEEEAEEYHKFMEELRLILNNGNQREDKRCHIIGNGNVENAASMMMAAWTNTDTTSGNVLLAETG